MNILRHGYGFGGVLARTLPEELRESQLMPMAFSCEDERWMHKALLAAMEQVGVPAPNPTVGCAIVADGQLLTVGATQRFGGLHAERSAIAALENPSRLKGATAYVTLEPCCHHGKQPPCTKALIDAGIAHCVIAAPDSHPLVDGGGIKALREAGCRVTIGPLRTEATAFNYPFFAAQLLRRPVFIGKWAQTIDGQLADDDSNARWISSPASRAYTHWLRQKYDAIMVGAGTLLNDVPALDVRSCAPPVNRHPLKIIFDPSARLFGDASPEQRASIFAKTLSPPGKAIYALSATSLRKGDEHGWWDDTFWQEAPHILRLSLDDENPAQDLAAKLSGPEVNAFYGLPLQSVLVEGGARLLSLLMDKDLIDCFHTFIAPALLGASRHTIATPTTSGGSPSGLFPQKCPSMQRHRLMTVQPIGEDALMEYVPEDRWSKIFKLGPAP